MPAAPLISDFVMTVLSNSRHEAFARAILQGKSGREAYIAAGYKAAGAELKGKARRAGPSGQGNESRLTRLWLQGAENVQQVLRVPGGALAAALD